MVNYVYVFIFILVVVFIAVGSYLASNGGDDSLTGGVLLAIGIIVLVLFLWYWIKKKEKKDRESEQERVGRANEGYRAMGRNNDRLGGINSSEDWMSAKLFRPQN